MQQRNQVVEPAAPRGGEEGVDDRALPHRVGRRPLLAALDLPPSPVRELLRRLGRAVQDRADLVERDGEGVVQHERQPLVRRERVEHHQQRCSHRVGERRLLGGIRGVARRVRGSAVHRPVGRPCPEHVQRYARDHGGQPAAEVVDAACVGAAQPQPGLLHGVLGLRRRPEDPRRHGAQPAPVLLEPRAQPVLLRHVLPPRPPTRHGIDDPRRPGVTPRRGVQP
jgi:hypothetical protein